MRGLTEMTADAIIPHKIGRGSWMPAEYEIGQKVTIKPVSEKSLSPRDSDLRQYASLTGEITNYYWMRPPTGEVFYLYTVRISTSNKEIVLYGDEIVPIQSIQRSRHRLKAK